MILYVVRSYFLKHSPTGEFSLRFSKSSDLHLGLQFPPQTSGLSDAQLGVLEEVLNQEQCMFCVVVMLEDKVIYFVFTYHSFFMNPSTDKIPSSGHTEASHSTPITAFQCVCS